MKSNKILDIVILGDNADSYSLYKELMKNTNGNIKIKVVSNTFDPKHKYLDQQKVVGHFLHFEYIYGLAKVHLIGENHYSLNLCSKYLVLAFGTKPNYLALDAEVNNYIDYNPKRVFRNKNKTALVYTESFNTQLDSLASYFKDKYKFLYFCNPTVFSTDISIDNIALLANSKIMDIQRQTNKLDVKLSTYDTLLVDKIIVLCPEVPDTSKVRKYIVLDINGYINTDDTNKVLCKYPNIYAFGSCSKGSNLTAKQLSKYLINLISNGGK